MTLPLALAPGGLHWQPDPLVTAGLLALALAYARGLRALRPPGSAHPPGSARRPTLRGVTRGQVAAFAAALAALALALASPLDALAETRFSLHMLQHVLLMLVAAPLLALAAPGLPLTLALPPRPRRTLARWRHHRAARAAWRALTLPLVVLGVHGTVLWGWHLPAAYEAALANPVLHALEHLTFLGSAWLLWLVALTPTNLTPYGPPSRAPSPSRARAHAPTTTPPTRVGGDPSVDNCQDPDKRLSTVSTGARRSSAAPGLPVAVLLVFVTAIQGNVLGAIITLAPAPLYPEQVADLADQQLAGLLMWVPGDVIYLAVALALFRRWLAAVERSAPAGDAVLPDAPARRRPRERQTIQAGERG